MTRHRTLPYLAVAGILLIGGAVWWSFQVAEQRAELDRQRAFLGRSLQKPQMRPATAQEKRAALATIRAQLDAFRRDDYVEAAKYQSQRLKKNFPSIAAFRRSIREGYPQFANYQKLEVDSISTDKKGQMMVVQVRLTGRDKVMVRGVYLLTREGDVYRVSGVAGGANPKRNPQQKPPEKSPGNKLSSEMVA